MVTMVNLKQDSTGSKKNMKTNKSNMGQVNIYMGEKLHTKLLKLAEEEDRSVSYIARKLIEKGMRSLKKSKNNV